MKKKFNKVSLILGFTFIILLSFIGCAPKGDPSQVLNSYYQNIKDGDIEGAYDKLSEASKKNFSKEDFIKWQDVQKQIYVLKESKVDKANEFKEKELDGIKFKNVVEFSVVEKTHNVYENKEDTLSYERYVVNDNGSWKIYRGEENGKEIVAEALNILACLYIDGKGNKPKDLNQAAIILNEALKYSKDNVGVNYALARTYGELKRFDEAIEPANKYIEKSSDNNQKSDGYNLLGVIYESKNNFNKSIECYNKAIQLNPNNQYAKTNLERAKKY